MELFAGLHGRGRSIVAVLHEPTRPLATPRGSCPCQTVTSWLPGHRPTSSPSRSSSRSSTCRVGSSPTLCRGHRWCSGWGASSLTRRCDRRPDRSTRRREDPPCTARPPMPRCARCGTDRRRYRSRLIFAVTMSTINKIADVVPELLIGAAIDVVVNGQDSFVSTVLGVDSRYAQLGLAGRDQRRLLGDRVRLRVRRRPRSGAASRRASSTTCASRPTTTCSTWTWAGTSAARRARRWPRSTTTSTSWSASSTSGRRRSCRPRSTWSSSERCSPSPPGSCSCSRSCRSR